MKAFRTAEIRSGRLRRSRPALACGALALFASFAVSTAQSGRSYGGSHVWWDAGDGGILPFEEDYDNPTGQLTILNTAGFIHTRGNAFFEPLGVNGRACVTCHQPSNAMSVSVASARSRWAEKQSKDPLFAAIDGSNCPDQPQEMMSSHSLLLERGLFRISLPWPPKDVQPDFQIEVVRDPTGCNRSPSAVSVYRRPRIAANLKHVVAGPAGISFMADSREPSLRVQAINAAMIHEQKETAPNAAELRQIIDFETQIYVAQSADLRGGLLDETLGPEKLSAAAFGLPPALSFNVWKKPSQDSAVQREFRASVARGSDLFFDRCASCHKAGTTRWMNIGSTNMDLPDLPLFRITCGSRVTYTQDPGRALVSGKCADRRSATQRAGSASPVFFERLSPDPPRRSRFLQPAFHRATKTGSGEFFKRLITAGHSTRIFFIPFPFCALESPRQLGRWYARVI